MHYHEACVGRSFSISNSCSNILWAVVSIQQTSTSAQNVCISYGICVMYKSCHTLSLYVLYKYVADPVASTSYWLTSTVTDSSSRQMQASIHQNQSMSKLISAINGNRIRYNNNCCGSTTWQGSWHFATAGPFHMHWCRSCTQQHRTATAHPHDRGYAIYTVTMFEPNHKSNDHRWYKQNSYLMFWHTPASVD